VKGTPRRSRKWLAVGLVECLVLVAVPFVVNETPASSIQAIHGAGPANPHPSTLPESCGSGDASGLVKGSLCTVLYTSDSQWQTFTVPDGIESVEIEASGAYGGGFCDPYDGGGAPGGANGTLSVTPGEVIKVFVGFVGTNASLTSDGGNCDTGDGAGGYGGGGHGGFSGSYGAGYDGAAGGGGGAAVVTTNGALELVAGGGGGSGQGGQADGYLQPGVTYANRAGAGGAGGGGVNRPTGATNGTASGFGGGGVGGICGCDNSGSGGGTISGPGDGGKAGLTYTGSSPAANGTIYATASAGHDGSGPATAAGAATGGQGAGDAKACRYDDPNSTPEIEFSEGGGGGGGYYGGGGGGCGWGGGGGGGGGSSYVASNVTSSSFVNLINPPVAGNQPSLNGYYSNSTSALVSIAYPTCTGSSGSSNLRSHAELAHAKGDSCPLTVTVKAQNASRAGLAIDNDELKYGPVNFTSETTGGGLTEPVSAGQKCESGCTNLLVTVTDPKTKKPVTDATVEAKVAITSAPAHLFGDEFICEQSEATVPKCGTDLSNLSTDQKGQVHLIYWAPGFVPTDSAPNLVASVSVTAKESCSSSVCTAKKREGTGNLSLTVAPYKIYDSEAQLSAVQVGVLIDLATEKSITINPADTLALHQMTEPAVEFLEATEREAIANLVRLPAAYGEAIIEVAEMGEAIASYGEAAPLTGVFLKALDLSPIGINEPPFEKSASGAGVQAFWTEIGGGLGSFAPLSLKGVLATDGEALADQSRNAPSVFATPPETVDLNVYDVTHCDMSNPNCGPGYSGSRGIQPELCFSFDGSDRLPTPKLDWNYEFCAKTYDPVAWVESQNRLNRAIPGKTA
jgi:hypothetical protein